MNSPEEHFCDGGTIALDKYLQLGFGIGRDILAIGESPAANGWRKSGRAFFTIEGKTVPTGKNFLVNLQQIDKDLNLENISFTEIAKCFIGSSRNKLMSCADKTWPHFISQIDHVKPKIIILLGKKTTEIFSQLSGNELVIGQIQNFEVNGDVYRILPIYHPSPLNPKRVHNLEFIDNNKNEIRTLLNI